eukprot:TRINITY_DN3502_c0_g1_i2.p1 TRINITY_DN3502_c0_g1~~TRINITY_DN3502_c0_g1_i2.p1  ORF type:complete len:332 (-),score=80.39 TRINITY_DN3502_c0_g1_i2:115-1089(-)
MRVSTWLTKLGDLRGMRLGAPLVSLYDNIVGSLKHWPSEQAKFVQNVTRQIDDLDKIKETADTLSIELSGRPALTAESDKSTGGAISMPVDSIDVDAVIAFDHAVTARLSGPAIFPESAPEEPIDWAYWNRTLLNKKAVAIAQSAFSGDESVNLLPARLPDAEFAALEAAYGKIEDPKKLGEALEKDNVPDPTLASLHARKNQIIELGVDADRAEQQYRRGRLLVYRLKALEVLWNRKLRRADRLQSFMHVDARRTIATTQEDIELIKLESQDFYERLVLLLTKDLRHMSVKYPQLHQIYAQFVLEHKKASDEGKRPNKATFIF